MTDRFARRLRTAALTSLLLLATAAIASAETVANELRFEANNAIYDAQGSFKTWHFTEVSIPGGDLTKGRVAFEVDLASVSEKTAALAEHLRTNDFFDVDLFPIATVVIHDAVHSEGNRYQATATVTIRETTAEVPASFEVIAESPLQIRGEATLDRVAFGIGGPYDAAEETSIREEVKIFLSATLPDQP